MTPSAAAAQFQFVRGTAVVINRDMRKRAWKRVTICALRSEHMELAK